MSLAMFFKSVKKAADAISSAKEVVSDLNNYFFKNPNYTNIRNIVALRCDSKEDAKIDDYLNTIKVKTYNLTKARLKDLHKEYKSHNSSGTSRALWALEEADDINDIKRAEIIMKFMCNKENWVRGTCVFLWKKFSSTELFVEAPVHILSHEEEKVEKNMASASSLKNTFS